MCLFFLAFRWVIKADGLVAVNHSEQIKKALKAIKSDKSCYTFETATLIFVEPLTLIKFILPNQTSVSNMVSGFQTSVKVNNQSQQSE